MAITKTTKKKSTKTTNGYHGRTVLVRSHLAGVFVGECVGEPTYGDAGSIVLKAARRIYYWKGALCVDTIATKGVASGSRVADARDQTISGGILQVIPCTPEAVASIKAQPIAQ